MDTLSLESWCKILTYFFVLDSFKVGFYNWIFLEDSIFSELVFLFLLKIQNMKRFENIFYEWLPNGIKQTSVSHLVYD